MEEETHEDACTRTGTHGRLSEPGLNQQEYAQDEHAKKGTDMQTESEQSPLIDTAWVLETGSDKPTLAVAMGPVTEGREPHEEYADDDFIEEEHGYREGAEVNKQTEEREPFRPVPFDTSRGQEDEDGCAPVAASIPEAVADNPTKATRKGYSDGHYTGKATEAGLGVQQQTEPSNSFGPSPVDTPMRDRGEQVDSANAPSSEEGMWKEVYTDVRQHGGDSYVISLLHGPAGVIARACTLEGEDDNGIELRLDLTWLQELEAQELDTTAEGSEDKLELCKRIVGKLELVMADAPLLQGDGTTNSKSVRLVMLPLPRHKRVSPRRSRSPVFEPQAPPKVKLFKQVQRFCMGQNVQQHLVVKVFEEDETLIVSAEKKGGTTALQLILPAVKLREVHKIDSLATLPPYEKAVLVNLVLNRLSISLEDGLAPTLELAREPCHVPRRADVVERARLQAAAEGHLGNHQPLAHTSPRQGRVLMAATPRSAREGRPHMTQEDECYSISFTPESSPRGQVDERRQTSPASFELFKGPREFGGRVFLVAMYDTGQALRVVGNELGSSDVLTSAFEPATLGALGYADYVEMTTEQKLELCEKVWECLSLEDSALIIEVPEGMLCKVTLVTRGVKLGVPSCLVKVMEEDGKRVIVSAEEVTASSQKPSSFVHEVPQHVLQSLVRTTGQDGPYTDLRMKQKLAVCEELLSRLVLLASEDSSSKVLTTRVSREPRTLRIITSCSTPLLSASSPRSQLLPASTRIPWRMKDAMAPKDVIVLLTRTVILSDRHLCVSIFEIPAGGLLRATDLRTRETQWMVLGGSVFAAIGFKAGLTDAKPTQKSKICEAVLEHLCVLRVDGSLSARIALAAETQQHDDSHQLLIKHDKPSRVAGQTATAALFDDGKSLRIVVTDGEVEVTQTLSEEELASLGCNNFSRLRRSEEKIAFAEKINGKTVALQVFDTEAPSVSDVVASYLDKLSPPGTMPNSAHHHGDRPAGHRTNLRRRCMVAGRPYEFVIEQGVGPPRLVLEDTEFPGCRFSVQFTDRDAQALGFISVKQVLHPENVEICAAAVSDSIQVRQSIVSSASTTVPFDHHIHAILRAEQHKKIRFLVHKANHDIDGRRFEVAVIEEPNIVRAVVADATGSTAEQELIIDGKWLSLLVKGGDVSGLTEEKRQKVGMRVLQSLSFDPQGRLRFGIRRGGCAKKQQDHASHAHVYTVPRDVPAHVKAYATALAGLERLSSRGATEDALQRTAELLGGQSIEDLHKMRAGIRTADEMLGLPRNYVLDPYTDVLTHRCQSLTRYRRKGLKPIGQKQYSYASYWEQKGERVLRYFSTERSLRKALSVVRSRCAYPLTEKEAFCALATTGGSVAEAYGKLLDDAFCEEMQLAAKIVDLEPYQHLLAFETGSVSHTPLDAVCSGTLTALSMKCSADGTAIPASACYSAPASLGGGAAQSRPHTSERSKTRALARQRRASLSGHAQRCHDEICSLFVPPVSAGESRRQGGMCASLNSSPAAPAMTPLSIPSTAQSSRSSLPGTFPHMRAGNSRHTRRCLEKVLNATVAERTKQDLQELKLLTAAFVEAKHRVYPTSKVEREAIFAVTCSLDAVHSQG